MFDLVEKGYTNFQFRVVSPIVKWKISTGAMAMSVL